MKKMAVRASALVLGLVAAAVASAQTVPTDIATITAAGVTSIGQVSSTSASFASPLFALAVVGVGIAIAVKYIKKGKGAA